MESVREQKLTETAWELWFEGFCTCSRDVNWMDKRVDELGSGMCRSREIHHERKKAAGWSGKGLHTCQWNLGIGMVVYAGRWPW